MVAWGEPGIRKARFNGLLPRRPADGQSTGEGPCRAGLCTSPGCLCIVGADLHSWEKVLSHLSPASLFLGCCKASILMDAINHHCSWESNIPLLSGLECSIQNSLPLGPVGLPLWLLTGENEYCIVYDWSWQGDPEVCRSKGSHIILASILLKDLGAR